MVSNSTRAGLHNLFNLMFKFPNPNNLHDGFELRIASYPITLSMVPHSSIIGSVIINYDI